MTTVMLLADHPFAQALAWALLHFLWQGALLALAAFLLFRRFGDSARARYTTGVLTLAAMLVAPALTATWQLAASPTLGTATADFGATLSSASITAALATAKPVAASASPAPTGAPATTLVVLTIWIAGVLVLSIRLLGGWLTARHVARRAQSPARSEIQSMARRLAGRLALPRIVRVAESASLAVPVMIGWLKPVVILPTAVVSGFTPEQVEALLAHELAHVRRHDYLVNLLQTIVETLLFYHPAVWWVSARVRTEREHCCDDMAVTICDRLVYARALSDLAEMTAPHMAMAATRGSLVGRVRRVLGRAPNDTDGGWAWLPLVVIVALAVPVFSASITAGRQSGQDPVPTPQAAQASTPATAATAAPSAASVPATAMGPTATHPPLASSEATTVHSSAPATTAPSAAVALTGQQSITNREQIEAALKEWDAAQRQLEAQQADLDLAKSDAQWKAQLAELQANLGRLRDELSQAQKKVELGLGSTDAVREIEEKLAALQREIEGVQLQRQFAVSSSELAQKEAEQKREYERLIREYSSSVEMLTNEGTNLTRTEAVTDPSEKIRQSDFLIIEVVGEPDLPLAYRVGTDGTIRLPLMTAVHVEGLTARQASETIAKQLADRHVAEHPQVTLMVRRPK